MSDLISRGALMEKLKKSRKYHAQNGREQELLCRCENIVMKQPTAYDVDKVVEGLKETGTSYCCSVHCNNECENCDHGAMMRAIIDIVRKGGVCGQCMEAGGCCIRKDCPNTHLRKGEYKE